MKMKQIPAALVACVLTTVGLCAADDLTNTYYRIRADFNADGIPDVATSTTRNNFGNAGGLFTFYVGTTNGTFTRIGSVFMHPLAANLVKTKAGEGILTVFIRGGHEGVLMSYAVTRTGIVERERRSLIARDGGPEEDRKIYRSFFDDSVRLKAELRTGIPDGISVLLPESCSG